MELTAHFTEIIKTPKNKNVIFVKIFLLEIKIELFFPHGHDHKQRKNGAKNFWDRSSLKSPVCLCIIQIETAKHFFQVSAVCFLINLKLKILAGFILGLSYRRNHKKGLLGPVYMEKSYPGKEGHPPSRVNFSDRLYEKKVDPFARANSARACSDLATERERQLTTAPASRMPIYSRNRLASRLFRALSRPQTQEN